MRTKATFLLVLCFLAFIACSKKTESDSKEIAEDQNKENVDKDLQRDSEFAVSAADGGLLEVKLGELAHDQWVVTSNQGIRKEYG